MANAAPRRTHQSPPHHEAAQCEAPSFHQEPANAVRPDPCIRRLRVAKRKPISIAAALVMDTVTLPVTVCDVSVSGLGITGQAGLVPGSDVALDLPDRRRLYGVLKWANGARAGIELQQSLDPGDPVFGPLEASRVTTQQRGTAENTTNYFGVLWSDVREQVSSILQRVALSDRDIAYCLLVLHWESGMTDDAMSFKTPNPLGKTGD